MGEEEESDERRRWCVSEREEVGSSSGRRVG
jgi:hypothetical protein